jgi:6-phosphogluconolactonase
MTQANLGAVLVAPDGDALAATAAHLVRALVSEAALASRDGVARVALSGGSTPRAMCRVLRHLDVPWPATEWFFVDERAVPADSPRSNFGAAREDLFGGLSTPPRGLHPMVASPDALDAAATEYEAALGRSFGMVPPGGAPTPLPSFDLLLLGVGDDGHTASLFPGDAFIDVEDRWVVGVPAAPGREARLTLTRPVITAARRVIVLAQGAAKKGPIERARSGGPLREVPSRLTQEIRGELLWLVDSAANPGSPAS